MFVDLDAEVAGLQAWLESVATPAVRLEPTGPVEPGESPFRWDDLRPGGEVMDAIAGHELGSLDDEDLLSACVAIEKSRSWQDAVQAKVLGEFASRRPGYLGEAPASLFDEGAGDEVAAAMCLAPRTGAARLDWAIELIQRLPKTLAAMESGSVTSSKARIISEETLNLSPEAVAAVEAQVLDGVADITPGQLRRQVKRAVVAVDAEAAQRRTEEAKKERKVVVSHRPDGMAEFTALLPAQHAVALYARLDDLARRARSTAETRSMDQLRADVLADVIYGNAGPTGRALVQLIMTDATLIGKNDDPADLIGYGPVTATTARNIAAESVWQSLRTDDTGVVTGVGRNRYRPSAALADLIRARDRTCRFPGCAQPAARADIDHTIHFPDGKTEEANLGCLCRRHHQIKTIGENHNAGWKVEQHDHGELKWTSPTGRTYITYPRRFPTKNTTNVAPKPTPINNDPPPF